MISASTEKEIRDAESVSEELRRIREQMSREVDRSSETMKVLEDSSKTITKIKGEYFSFEAVLSRGKSLLTRLISQDKMDYLVVFSGLAFFLLCVLYVINRRIPIKIQHIYKLSKLSIRFGRWVFLTMFRLVGAGGNDDVGAPELVKEL